jgi:hypothetical protein
MAMMFEEFSDSKLYFHLLARDLHCELMNLFYENIGFDFSIQEKRTNGLITKRIIISVDRGGIYTIPIPDKDRCRISIFKSGKGKLWIFSLSFSFYNNELSGLYYPELICLRYKLEKILSEHNIEFFYNPAVKNES